MAHNLARNNLQTLPRSTISHMSPAAPIFQPAMARQKVLSRLSRGCWKTQTTPSMLCCPTEQLHSHGQEDHQQNCWWDERFAVCCQYPKRNWYPILETSVWTMRVSRAHRKPSTIDVTESRSYQTYQTTPRCGWPLMIISQQEPLLEGLTLQDLILCKHHVAS